jgi:hypothetical protein
MFGTASRRTQMEVLTKRAKDKALKSCSVHRPGIEPGAGRHSEDELLMATANFTTKQPMHHEARSGFLDIVLSPSTNQHHQLDA